MRQLRLTLQLDETVIHAVMNEARLALNRLPDQKSQKMTASDALIFTVAKGIVGREVSDDVYKSDGIDLVAREVREFGDPAFDEITLEKLPKARPHEVFAFMREMNAGTLDTKSVSDEGKVTAMAVYIVDPLHPEQVTEAMEKITDLWAEESPADGD